MLLGSLPGGLLGEAVGALDGSALAIEPVGAQVTEPKPLPDPLSSPELSYSADGNAVGVLLGAVNGALDGSELPIELGSLPEPDPLPEPVSIPPSYPTGPPLQSATTSAIELLTPLLQHVPTATTTPEESNTVHNPSAQLDVDASLEHDPIPNVSPGIAPHTVCTNHSLGMSLRLIFS